MKRTLITAGLLIALAGSMSAQSNVEKAERFRVQTETSTVESQSASEVVQTAAADEAANVLENNATEQLQELGPRWRWWNAGQIGELGSFGWSQNSAQLDELGPRWKWWNAGQLEELGKRYAIGWSGGGNAQQLEELGPRWKWWNAGQIDELGPRYRWWNAEQLNNEQ